MSGARPVSILNPPKRWRNQKKRKASTAAVNCFTFTCDDIRKDTDSVAHFARISADGRRRFREQIAIAPPSPERYAYGTQLEDTANEIYPYEIYPLEFQHVDILERQVAKEDAVKPRSRRYLSSVSESLLQLRY
jgi:hypothetical protein